MVMNYIIQKMLLVILGCTFALECHAQVIDLTNATIVIRDSKLPAAELAAHEVLSEEIDKRTKVRLPIQSTWPAAGPVIAITSTATVPEWNRSTPEFTEIRPEGYRLYTQGDIVWILGADARGTLYGVGDLLRQLEWSEGALSLTSHVDRSTAPVYPIRGHQLGYRHRANSWDAWTPEQFDQYIRELSFFGVNSIENIPFQDERVSPLMKVSRREMNAAMSAICVRYGMDYWVWTAAEYDLADETARQAGLDRHEQLYQDCKELTGVFFPGGDPGSNPPELVLPFLKDIADRLMRHHPDAQVWLSLQWFNETQIAYIYEYLETESPDWLGGLVAGPSSPPIPETRNRLPKKYQYRLYPDITHNKICQYPVPWWDQSLALTLGREAINPRPVHYAYIHNWFAPHSDGFISYSDGVHDDVNKTIWSSLGWNPNADPREILKEYSRVFFDPAVADRAADGMLALEKNWEGPLVTNGAVEGALLQWQALEKDAPQLNTNWRWQMNLVRAYYDAYIRRRLIYETQLENEANAVLAQAATLGVEQSMEDAMAILNQSVDRPVASVLRTRIDQLCDDLYQSIALQTSVSKYGASGAERGAFLDFVDYPLNNRWWLEDEMMKVRQQPTEKAKIQFINTLAHWENPGPGGAYDDIGNPAQSPHVKRSEFVFTEPGEEVHPEPTLWWWDNGLSRARLSWQVTMNYPEAVVYDGLDPLATYTIRCGGYGKFLLRIDGELAEGAGQHFEMGENQSFVVPTRLLEDSKLVLTWDRPSDEGHLNWRKHSRLAEIWLIKK